MTDFDSQDQMLLILIGKKTSFSRNKCGENPEWTFVGPDTGTMYKTVGNLCENLIH